MQSTFKGTLITLRRRSLVFLTHKVGLPYFKLFRKRVRFDYTLASLQTFPKDSVGFHLYCFLKNNHLSLLPYYEKHDIKHVVLGYPPTEKGEVCLQCFMLANGRRTFPVLVAVVFGMLTMPAYWPDFKEAFMRGYNNKSLRDVKWTDLLPFSTTAIQALLLQAK